MIQNLRKQLTLLYTVTTGLILTAVIVGVLAVSTGQFQKKNLENFQNYILTITSRLQTGSTVDCTWLSRLESDGRLIIHIEDNGIPFLYSGSWNPLTDRSVLVARAKEMAASESIRTDQKPVSSSLMRSSVFTLTGNRKDTYYGTVLVIPSSKGYQSLTLISYKDPGSAGLYRQRFLLFFLNAAGITALFFVSWCFVGKSLKPVAESQQKQHEFIAAASHELRSPLAVIRSSLTAIPALPDKQEVFLKNMDAECTRMSGLINDLLLLASTDAKTWPLHLAELDMDTLLITIYEKFEILYREKNVSLTLKLPEDSLPHLTADSQRIEQVLSILLDNALTYTPEYKQVELFAHVRNSKKKNNLHLSVTDEGCGISEDAKKHIFDRFYRADSARTDKQHFGLGLSIAKELISLHGGTITVTDSQSGGASFLITLPLPPSATAAKSNPE